MNTPVQTKERVTIRLDAEIVAFFKAKAAQTMVPYQRLIDKALKDHVQLQQAITATKETK